MSRLIDADELEKVMTEDWFLENLAAQDGKSAVKKDIVNMIDSVPLAEGYDNNASVSKTETVGWIPCSERLPEESGKYLVTVENLTGYWIMKNDVFVCDYQYNEFVFQGWEDNKVIAWQPLPEPYKPEGE